LLEVDVEFSRVLVLREAAQQQQQQQLLPAGQQALQAAGQQQQQGDNSLYWRPFKFDGEEQQYLLGCVCLNVFTGKVLAMRFPQWPKEWGLPVLEPAPRWVCYNTVSL
jgi:hypothetical protein